MLAVVLQSKCRNFAQVMIDRFNVDAIINTGIAGGMNSKVRYVIL